MDDTGKIVYKFNCHVYRRDSTLLNPFDFGAGVYNLTGKDDGEIVNVIHFPNLAYVPTI